MVVMQYLADKKFVIFLSLAWCLYIIYPKSEQTSTARLQCLTSPTQAFLQDLKKEQRLRQVYAVPSLKNSSFMMLSEIALLLVTLNGVECCVRGSGQCTLRFLFPVCVNKKSLKGHSRKSMWSFKAEVLRKFVRPASR